MISLTPKTLADYAHMQKKKTMSWTAKIRLVLSDQGHQLISLVHWYRCSTVSAINEVTKFNVC